MNKYNAHLKSSLIFRELLLKLKYVRILITALVISKIELITNNKVLTYLESEFTQILPSNIECLTWLDSV